MAGIVCSKFFDKHVHVDRRDGVINVDWKPLIKLEANAPNDYEIRWNCAAADALSVNKEKIMEEFEKLAKAPRSSNVEWTLG